MSGYEKIQDDPSLYRETPLRVGAVTFTPEINRASKKAVASQEVVWEPGKAFTFPPTGLDREQFGTGAVRNNAEGKGRFDLLPFEGVQEWAIALEEGAKTYPDKNWELGIPVARCLSSALRHIHQYMAGMTDEAHLRAALWNVGAAVTIEKRALAGKLPKSLLMDTRPRGA